MIKKLLKKYKIAILVAAVVIIIGVTLIVILNSSSQGTKELVTEYYETIYDKSWSVKQKDEDEFSLKHSNGSTLSCQIISLDGEYEYLSISNLIDEVKNEIKTQNEEYSLIANEECSVTSSYYDGYKMLYECEENQVLVVVTKISDKLVMFTYDAKTSYYDITLDSAQNIIYNFVLKDESFDVADYLSLELASISFSSNDELKETITNTTEYEIASNNYLVDYTLPSNFKMSTLDTNWQYFNFNGLSDNKKVTLIANISNRNIYEYLENDGTYGNLYSQLSSIRECEDDTYTDFKEELSQMQDYEESYIYRASYVYNGTLSTKSCEEVYLIYTLDENHIFVISISAENITISSEIIGNIKILNYENYSSYIQDEIEDGLKILRLKEYYDLNKDKIISINIKVPQEYIEVDHDMNKYEYRYLGLEYNEDQDEYNYEIDYYISSSIESTIKNIGYDYTEKYGEYEELTQMQNTTINGRTFILYSGGYTNSSYLHVSKTVLFYELETEDYLVIEISGNGFKISDELLNDVTNFDIEIENI